MSFPMNSPEEIPDLDGAGFVPPHSIDAEMSVLGAMLLGDRSAVDAGLILLQPEDFYRLCHGRIFDAMRSISHRNEAVDIITLKDELLRLGQLDECGGFTYLMQLGDFVPTTANLQYYARIVLEKAGLRRLMDAGRAIIGLAYDAHTRTGGYGNTPETSPRIAAETAERLVMEAAAPLTINAADDLLSPSERKDPVPVWAMLQDEIAAIEERGQRGDALLGPSTGYAAIDRLTSGCEPGTLWLLGARPSVGKTALACCIGENVAKAGGKVANFSMEMTRKPLMHRLLSQASGVPMEFIRKGGRPDPETGKLRPLTREDWERINEAASRLWRKSFWVDDTRALTPSAMKSRARRLRTEMGGLDLVIVDHALLMHSDRQLKDENEKFSSISNGLQALSRELGVCVLALMQLNREVEKRQDKRPQLSDLRSSGTWEQDADIVSFLYRPAYYDETDENTVKDAHGITRDEVEFLVEKNRQGERSLCKLQFAREIVRYDSLIYQTSGPDMF